MKFFPGIFFRRRHAPVTFADLVPKFLDSRREMNLRRVSIQNYDCFGRAVIRERGGQAVDDFTEEDLREMITRHSRSAAMDMAVLLRWALRRKLITVDVTRAVFEQAPRKDCSPPDCWTPAEAHGFYHCAAPEHRAAFALALFAGVRPYEIIRIRWESIDVVGRKIRIEPTVSKIRRQRIIEGGKPSEGGAPTILWAQLMLHWQPSGFVFPRTEGTSEKQAASVWIRARRDTAKRACIRLPKNVLRHSFATYFAALTGNPALAARILGHCDLAMLARHYDGVASRRLAEDYFRPRPVLALPPPKDQDEP